MLRGSGDESTIEQYTESLASLVYERLKKAVPFGNRLVSSADGSIFGPRHSPTCSGRFNSIPASEVVLTFDVNAVTSTPPRTTTATMTNCFMPAIFMTIPARAASPTWRMTGDWVLRGQQRGRRTGDSMAPG